MKRPFKTYNGGKNGSGVYQQIINQIPPHDIFISGFAGNCGVLANKTSATMADIAIDKDAAVIEGWNAIPGIMGINADTLTWLPNYVESAPAGTDIFIFLDPPYLKSVRSSQKNLYKNEMTDPASHISLLQALVNNSCFAKCHILITHYPCELYNKELKGWRIMDIKGRTRQGIRIERLYMNYPPPVKLHDYRYFGNDFREREAYKKMKSNMISKFQRMQPIEKNFIINSLQEKNIF